MSHIRKIFYKIALIQSDGRLYPLTVATTDINKIQELVERHKILYNALGYSTDQFRIVDTLYSFNMSQEKYEEELSMVDINDDIDDVKQLNSPRHGSPIALS